MTLVGTDYIGFDGQGQQYNANVCADTNLVRTTEGSPVVQTTGAGIVALGKLSTQTFSSIENEPFGGVILKYTGGLACGNGVIRSSQLNLLCAPNAGQGNITSVEEVDTCTYVITIPSQRACPVLIK